MALTNDEEKYLSKFVALKKAEILFNSKITALDTFRGNLQSQGKKKDEIAAEAKSLEDEVKLLELDVKSKEAELG